MREEGEDDIKSGVYKRQRSRPGPERVRDIGVSGTCQSAEHIMMMMMRKHICLAYEYRNR